MNAIAAIPTRYAGVQFRSRLEARWAAFFDLGGWRWEYEPVDLAGYIPDFVLANHLGDGGSAIVEIKPIVEWPCAVDGCDCGGGDRDDYDRAVKKIRNSGWTQAAYLAGAVWRRPGQLGIRAWSRRIDLDDGDMRPDEVLAFCKTCISSKPSASCRVVLDLKQYDADGESCSAPAGRCSCGGPLTPFDYEPWWREAGNRVQWQPKIAAEVGISLVTEFDQSPLGVVRRELKRASEHGDRDRARLLAQLVIAIRRNDAANIATLRASLGMEATA